MGLALEALGSPTFMVVEDPRLEGWVPMEFYLVPDGSSVSVEQIIPLTVGDEFSTLKRCAVAVQLTVPSQPPKRFPHLIPFRPDVPTEDPHQWEGLFKAEFGIQYELEVKRLATQISYEMDPTSWTQEGPSPSEQTRRLAANLLFSIAQLDVAHRSAAVRIATTAMQLGAITRASELRNSLGAAVERGERFRGHGIAGGRKRGSQLRRTAETWHLPAAMWVASILARTVPARRRISYADLADLVLERWDQRPFSEGPREGPDFMYLARVLLPRWEKEGRFQRPLPT